MKTNITCIHGWYVVKTGKVLVYENDHNLVFNDKGELVDPDEYSFSEEVINVCTGEHYGFDGIFHLIGNPVDTFINRDNKKRGRHSLSNNKKAARCRAARKILDDLPF